MLTVKQVLKDPYNPDDTQTNLYQATQVSNFTQEIGDAEAGDEIEFIRTVGFVRPDGGWSTIDRGTVYVMNQNGRTVDIFHLTGSPSN
jgi:hypothetical protein